jgi:glycine/D-amino acid oxidase-like deaminating enzyme
MRTDSDRFWAADVIVVGAGAAGLLATARLRRMGLGVAIIERDGFGSGQSNHSHGYLHRGHIYLKPSELLVQELGRGADAWAVTMSAHGIQPETASSYLCFTNAYEAEVAEQAWSSRGLAFSETRIPGSLREAAFARTFQTNEQSFDFTTWLARASEELHNDAGVTFVRGDAVGMEREGDLVTTVRVRHPDGSTSRLDASFVVLCAGTGNLALSSTVTRFRGHAHNRTSLMLVLTGSELERLSVVAHGHETRGLFIVSRTIDGEPVWLVSNYISFAGTAISEAASRLWLRDIRRSLERYTTGLDDPGARWGVYVAPKGELRNVRNTLDTHSVQRYGLSNLCVAAPTKLTLAPLLGEAVAQTVSTRLRARPRPAGLPELVADESMMPVAPEMWRSVGLSSIDSLMVT